jgi:EAL domain-containing protein (putative c-di-GMP-specific phosphodiesterase class I)
VTAVREWANRIRAALEADALVLHAQPVASLRGDAEQWELLVRLPTTDGVLLPPAEFLPTAERFGLIQRVDEWVTRRAVQVIAAYARVGRAVRLEVNVAAVTMAGSSFTEMVEAEVTAAGIDPSCLVFEVNGTVAAEALEDVAFFSQRLHQLGCLFALDNFGGGNGALEHLKTLPLDFVKIDGALVRHLATSPSDQVIVRALTWMAHGMGCRVVAMNVGDDESRALLDEYGVDYVQGFHVGRPVDLTELAR